MNGVLKNIIIGWVNICEILYSFLLKIIFSWIIFLTNNDVKKVIMSVILVVSKLCPKILIYPFTLSHSQSIVETKNSTPKISKKVPNFI